MQKFSNLKLIKKLSVFIIVAHKLSYKKVMFSQVCDCSGK